MVAFEEKFIDISSRVGGDYSDVPNNRGPTLINFSIFPPPHGLIQDPTFIKIRTQKVTPKKK